MEMVNLKIGDHPTLCEQIECIIADYLNIPLRDWEQARRDVIIVSDHADTYSLNWAPKTIANALYFFVRDGTKESEMPDPKTIKHIIRETKRLRRKSKSKRIKGWCDEAVESLSLCVPESRKERIISRATLNLPESIVPQECYIPCEKIMDIIV